MKDDIVVLSTAELSRVVNRAGSGLGRAEATRLAGWDLVGPVPHRQRDALRRREQEMKLPNAEHRWFFLIVSQS